MAIGFGGAVVGEHRAGSGEEVTGGVLGAHPRLDRVAAQDDVVLGQGERLAGGDAQLQLDEVQAGHQLSDGVLDLEPGIDLQEVVLGRIVGIGDELDRAGVDIAAGLHEGDRLGSELGAQLG